LSTAQLDVVIVGGGVQGLVALNALVAEGYSCALVSDGDLGSGQTIHSHGYLNTGFGMSGPELPRASSDMVQPYLEQRGLELSHDWVLIPPPNMPAFEGLPPAALPPGFVAPLGLTAVRLPDRSVAKRPLVEVLINGHHERILHGRATPRFNDTRVEAISVSDPGNGEEVILETKAIVVAAGCGSKRFLEGLVGQTAQTEQIKHRRVHMICVRAPRGALPTTSVVAMPLGLMLAAHDQPDDVTWYVTPMEMGGPSFDDVPGDAAGEVDPEIVSRGWMTLLALFPRLPEVEGLQIGCYAGYRQDIGDRSGNRMCELVEGTANVIVALPSGLIGAWLNATTLCEILGGLIVPTGAQRALPGGGVGVRVGDPVEDRPDFKWMGLRDWSEKYSRSGVVAARQAPL
jgi:glycine/D-amino acid oxidase-like deaminating enzyme